MQLLTDLGFVEVREVKRFDSFSATSSEKTARAFGVEGANFFARWPQQQPILHRDSGD
ncbi:MAG: hypothetical protein K0U98_01375 [Deltaproteobacteria bacterium]|nr:hypothetical protein [Deltaproteobacteria bacterium]